MKKRRRIIKWTALMMTVAILPVLAGLAVPQRVYVSSHDVYLKNLPPGLDGFTVVQLSDVHRCLVTPDDLIKSAVKAANRANPDVVVITGDFVHRNADNAGPCARILSGLKSNKGCYAVLGNHDYWTNADIVERKLEEESIKVLVNENIEIAPGVFLIGLDDYWAGKPNHEKAFKGIPKESANIVLSHIALAAKQLRGAECLILSGHTHGMQSRIPFIPSSVMVGLNGSRHVKGFYKEGKARVYVNEGVAMPNIPLRIFHRPEVSVFRLRCSR